MTAPPTTAQALPEDMRTVLQAYAGGELTNAQLYAALGARADACEDNPAFDRREPVGKAGKVHCVARRKVRWYQQSLKRLQLLERVPGQRGLWRLAPREKELTPIAPGLTLVGFSTDLGLALWSSCEVLARIDEPIALVLTSPPYSLARPRRYGGPTESEMVDFVTHALEPLVGNMLAGGSLALNVSNDIFVTGTPARSMYLERLTLALHDRLGLHLMDRLIWKNDCKAPAPLQWASKTRQQLNVVYEPILWFTNDPVRCFSDNRRVLQEHSPQHQRLMARGGEQRNAINNDGAYRITAGKSFSRTTPGRIPRNVLSFTHQAAEINALRVQARAHGLPAHGALMPLALAIFLIRFLTREGQLVVDPFGGWGTSAKAAEVTGRRWLISERIGEYVAAQALRLSGSEGFLQSFDLSGTRTAV
jgi:site-specific DNA-methyltransferase (cytosine-N4-specific)